MADNGKSYSVNCKGSMVSVGFFATLMENSIGFNKAGKIKAERLYTLAAACPQIPAGVLYDLVEGTLKYKIDYEAETFTILPSGQS